MKEYTPKMEDYGCPTCPLFNTEWNICNITENKCPKWHEDNEGNDHFDFPDDCPAKEGVKISFSPALKK